MRRTLHLFALVLALGTLSGGAAGEKAAAPARKVILIGWDGAGRENIKEHLAAGELPSIERIAEKGDLVAIDILRTTDTKAGWTQILTGYEPEKTGVYSNKRYQAIPEGWTLFERLEKRFGPGFVTVAVIGKKTNMDTDPPVLEPLTPAQLKKKEKEKGIKFGYRSIVFEGDQAYEKLPGKPYHHASQAVDVFENGKMKDEKVARRAMKLLEKYRDRSFFFFVHLAQIDHKGHAHGEGSPQQKAAYRNADRWTGAILDKLEELGIADETLVYVTADHGFDEGQYLHKDAPYIWLATNDPEVMRRGTRVDIAPTILTRFGIDVAKLKPALDGHTLTKPHTPPKW